MGTRRDYEDNLTDAVRSRYCRDPYGPPFCEHCDEEDEGSNLVRRDSLRGWVCKPCDSTLDVMYGRPRVEHPL